MGKGGEDLKNISMAPWPGSNSDANILAVISRSNDQMAKNANKQKSQKVKHKVQGMGGRHWSCQPCPDCIQSHAKLSYTSHHNRDRKRMGKERPLESSEWACSGCVRAIRERPKNRNKTPHLRRTTTVEQKL
jgi:hypothetical protein